VWWIAQNEKTTGISLGRRRLAYETNDVIVLCLYNGWLLVILNWKSGMFDDDVPNIEKPRPDVWRGRPLYEFIEDCWNNSIAVAGNKNVIANRLALVDQVFEDFHKAIKPRDISQLVPALLLLRSFSAYRASAMVSLSLPTDGYALQRSCLENAGYARLIADDASLSLRAG
jgi:hypothetical protein